MNWGRVISESTDGSQLDWYELCRQRYLCEVNTIKIFEKLTKKGAFVLHMSDDELDCFADFLMSSKCSRGVLLCHLDGILYKDKK